MAKEIGKVTKIDNSWMDIKVPSNKGCSSCGLKSACTFSGPDDAYRHFMVPFQTDIKEGDLVKLVVSDAAQNLSALIIFGSPTLLFFLSYLLINNYIQASNSEVWSVLITIVLYGIVLVLSNHWLSRLSFFQPKVTGVEKYKRNKTLHNVLYNNNH